MIEPDMTKAVLAVASLATKIHEELMGTKLKPGRYDCYERALPDEPMFVILGRDPDFFDLVSKWAKRRARMVARGLRPPEDMAMVHEAQVLAVEGLQWRIECDGKWRKSDGEDAGAAEPGEPVGGPDPG